MRLAGPFVVVVGDEAAANRFTKAEPIAPEVKADYERELREKGLVSEVELLYSDLMRAIRASGLPSPPA
jgi:hypothetical protein